jgi:hypothetical protein
MKSIRSVVILAALVTTACSAATVSPTPSSSQAAMASPSAAESIAPAIPPSPLTGDWATGQTTCAEQTAAVEAAGFTAEQMTLGDWSPTCAEGMPHGSRFTISFGHGNLLIFQDGHEGWSGLYRIEDDQTFEAGDAQNGYYITYHFVINGDQLTIDMTEDDCPQCTTPADVAGEQIAQTVIYETSPFTRED